MEKYIWSLDVSTTNVGCALWDSKGKLIELKHLELNADKSVDVEDRDIMKAEIFRNYCQTYKQYVYDELNGDIVSVFIEAPLPNTKININTTALLLGFNGMARFILYDVFKFPPFKITVHDSRRLFLIDLVHKERRKGVDVDVLSFPKEYIKLKKQYIWEKVSKLEPQIEWFYTRNYTLKNMCFDLSDSYVVGIAGLILSGIISKEDWKIRYDKI